MIVLALLAGVAETLLHMTIAVREDSAGPGELLTALLIRGTVYLAVLAVSFRMANGKPWARTTLVLGLGTLGLASLLIEPIAAVTSAEGDLFDGRTFTSWAIAACRAVHVITVLIALPAMLSARTYFRNQSGSRAARRASTVVTGRSQTVPRHT